MTLRLLAAPALAMGEVLALAASPTRVGKEVLGLDRFPDAADELRGPGEFRQRATGRQPFEPRLGGLEQHVEPQWRDYAVEQQIRQGIRRELQVPLQGAGIKATAGGLEIDQRAVLFD